VESPEATRQAAEFISRTQYKDIPEDVIELGKKSILDSIGLALAASATEMTAITRRYIVSVGMGRGAATVIGTRLKCPERAAAFFNGLAIHAFVQILYSRCCGIDVHKESVTACVLIYRETVEPEVRKKEFATHFKALLNLKQWLVAQKGTPIVMESTGVYWKPVWQALDEKFELVLANPYQVKNIPGLTGYGGGFRRLRTHADSAARVSSPRIC
jgi:hypothetical protein